MYSLKKTVRSLLVIMGVVVVWVSGANAEIPNFDIYFGIHGGANFVAGDWDLNKYSGQGYQPKHSPVAGVRVGAQIFYWLAAEGGITLIPYESTKGGDTNTALSWTADALFHFLDYDWTPFALAGVGMYQNVDGSMAQDTDFHGHWGLGVRGMVHDRIAFRAELRHIMSDGLEKNMRVSHNLELTAGFDFFMLGEEEEPPPPPPKVSDIDKDGIIDENDRCPERPGPAQYQGCPDTDGDGLPDIDDRCPSQPGPKALKGCPDTDGDGIVDVDDKCPKVKGVPEHQGCPAPLPDEVEEQFSGTMEGINFKTGSARILPASFPILDKAVTTLLKYPTVRVRIEGHTDSQGADAMNQKLSQDRANSVRDYLISKGVDASRIEAVGYGESRPIATNKTKPGRLKNRRIEFRIISR